MRSFYKSGGLSLGLLFACCMPLSGADPLSEAKKVEPHVREAFDRALGELPPPFREQLGDVRIMREHDLGLGSDSPLELRLLNRSAYASLNIVKRIVTFYDAGAKNKPDWEGPPPNADEVAKFLAEIADVIGEHPPKNGSDPDFQPAWEAFVKRVYSWKSDPLPEPVPDTENPVHVNDLHATALHLLGVDHEKLSYRFQSLDFKLTGVESSRIVHDILI